MTTKIARCSIYEDRPQVCKDYPKIDHYRPEECTYAFMDNERIGRCECNVGACCSVPREGGLPGGAPLPERAGGAPCKYLTWEEEDSEKNASLPIIANHPFDMDHAIKVACAIEEE